MNSGVRILSTTPPCDLFFPRKTAFLYINSRPFEENHYIFAKNCLRESAIEALFFFSIILFFHSLQDNHVLLRSKRRLSVGEAADFSVSGSPARSSLPQTYQDASGLGRSREIEVETFVMPLLGNVVFDGKLMATSEMFGCFMTMPPSYSRNTDLPENFRVRL